MRYRMELLDHGEAVVRNVETDIIMGSIRQPLMNNLNDPKGPVYGWEVLTDEGEVMLSHTFRGDLYSASSVVSSYEKTRGYADIKNGPKPANPLRMEFLLGSLMADAAALLALMVEDDQNSRPQTEPRKSSAN